MSHPQALTGISKQLADKLRPIVRPDHGERLTRLNAALQGTYKRLNGMLGFTGSPAILPNHHAVKYINDAKNKEEALLSYNVSILDVHLPQLIRTGNESVLGESTRVRCDRLASFLQNAEFFAKTIRFLFVNYDLVNIPNALAQQFISVDMFFAFKQLKEPLFNLFIANGDPCNS